MVNTNTTNKTKNAKINKKDQIDYILLTLTNQRQQLFHSGMN